LRISSDLKRTFIKRKHTNSQRNLRHKSCAIYFNFQTGVSSVQVQSSRDKIPVQCSRDNVEDFIKHIKIIIFSHQY